jgi:hypothetical protein
MCLILVKANGKVRLHKVKKTSATSYHIGRTWHLDEIKSIENVDVMIPTLPTLQVVRMTCGFDKSAYLHIHGVIFVRVMSN